ncbi:MAG: ATP-binding protein, partial [Myxococcota bacterium]
QLLDLEQIDARRMKLERVSVAPLSLLHAVEASFAAATEMKGVTLSVTGDHGSALMLDSNWMETALTNLTANALKFTQAGDTINLSVHDQGDEVVFEVRDSGEGIAPHELDSLFERFTRGAGSKTGTGIGLSLVHEAARLHGGRVNVRSTVGEGSTFHLHIPRVVAVHDAVTHSLAVHEATPDTCVERSGPDALAPLVFVAEDNPDVRTFIADVLSAHYRVRTFRNGGEVLDAVVEKTPDAFIVDVNMPVVGGLDLASALRKTAGCEDTPIVLVTARGEPNQVVEGFHAGVNDYVIKPFHARELLVRTDALVRARETTQRLIRREQLATVGMVAASVAHQIRNPLNALISGLSAVRTTLEVATSPGLDPPTARMFDVFLRAAQSIDSVSADLLYLSRSDRVASQRFAPGRGLAASVRLMEARFADSVEIDHAIDEEAEIEGYPGELHQVFISLLDNAARAMIDGGRVRVLGRANETLYEIAICDSGPGLPDGVLQQVLEGSLATGAFPSRGMGLTVAAGVAKRNGGAIYAGTSVYGGAEIRLTFPLAAAS